MRKILTACALAFAAILTGALLPAAPAHADEAYVVLVNAENDISGDDGARAEVVRLFMKRSTEWSNGLRAEPFDRSPDSPARQAFVSHVLDSSSSELDDWWLRLRQTRGETPPREVGSARLLLRAISRRDGAFGFAARSEVEPLPEDVRVLFEFAD